CDLSVTSSVTSPPCCAFAGSTHSASSSSVRGRNILEIANRIIPSLCEGRNVGKRDCPVRRPERPHTTDARWPLATTSTWNDDVPLKVENAANGNLIHAASCAWESSGERPTAWANVPTI